MEKPTDQVTMCQNMVELTQKLARDILEINLNLGSELKSMKKDLTKEYEGTLEKPILENRIVDIHEDAKIENKPEVIKEYCKTY